jgi:ABC-type multidrug transport system ATPase subunit
MNKKILRALIQLFALVARTDALSGRGRIVVENFLKRQLNSEQVDAYLLEFDELLKTYHSSGNEQKERKRASASSVKVLLICTQINEELTLSQKCFVLIRLIEFLSADGNLKDRDLDFAQTVSSTFNFTDAELDLCLAFAGPSGGPASSDSWLIICPKNEAVDGPAKNLVVDGLETHLPLIRLVQSGLCFIRMLGSQELYLNGQAMQHGRIYSFAQGSVIRGPKIQPVYYSDVLGQFLQHEGKEKLVFEARNIEYRFKNGKKGLHKFSFSEQSGRLIGIMGSSGAGKSTLLNILNGNEKPSKGLILINGNDLHDSLTNSEGLIGYCSQDDLLIEELTVFQNLWYNAKLCFSDQKDPELLKRVHHLLQELALLEIKDLKVGSSLNKMISGGQRKRLNIALELIREPAVLFVDEPTSGLSSRDSENIMDLLKELALKGKLVFVVIHQPSSPVFKMFDRLLLLDKGGFPVYYGNPVESVVYFKSLVDHVKAGESECPECGNVNPEQIFDIIESRVVDEHGFPTQSRKISPKEWNLFFKRSLPPEDKQKQKTALPVSDFNKPSAWGQWKVFFQRDFFSKLSNRQYMLINLLEAPLLALLMGYILRYSKSGVYSFYENINVPAYMLICVLAALFFGLTVSAEEIIRDRKIRKREQFLNLSQRSYLLAKVSLLFMLSAIQTFSFVIVGHAIMGIQDLYMDDWFILFSVSCFANLLGLTISASFNSAVTIYILIPILIIPQLLLSGVLVRFDQLNPELRQNPGTVPFTADLMASRWAFEALAVNRFSNNDYEKPLFPVDLRISYSNFTQNYWIPRMEELLEKLENQPSEFQLNQVKNEVERMNQEELVPPFPVTKINVENIKKKSVTPEILQWLSTIRSRCSKLEVAARTEKDKLISLRGNAISGIQEKYTNEQLDRMLKKSDNFVKIYSGPDGKLIRDFEPVFQIPEHGIIAAGQHYAPYKSFGSQFIATKTANVIVIWLMTIILYILLELDALRRLINLPEKLNFKTKS